MKRCLHCRHLFTGLSWRCPACHHEPVSRDGFPLFAQDLADEGAGFRPEVFKRLAELEERSFWFRGRNELIVWALKKFLPGVRHYLEIGCGTGYVLSGVARAFPSTRLVGTEVFSVGLPFALSRVRGAELLQVDARDIPYESEFDVIGAFDVLEHIDQDELVLESMRAALLPQGSIAITVPQHPWLWSATDDYACHVRRYRVGELRDKVLRAGFKIVFETSFVSLLLPAMYLSRMASRPSDGQHDSSAELKLPTFLNASMFAVMNLERWLIEHGARFALGGSCLLIAKKE